MSDFEHGALPFTYWEVEGERAEQVAGGVIHEEYVTLFVNGQEVATVMCSPIEQEALALGFLYNEGVIDSLEDVGLVQKNVSGAAVDVLLKRSDFTPPRRLTITTGCGGGITFADLQTVFPPLETNFQTTPELLLERMRELQGEAHLYNQVRGVHTAVLASRGGVLVSAEDVGRHNAVDKIAGKALQAGISTRDSILLTSGRVSSEMLNKARRMGVPLVASRTAATSFALQLAQMWNICVAGYLRRGSMRVYTHPQRLGLRQSP